MLRPTPALGRAGYTVRLDAGPARRRKRLAIAFPPYGFPYLSLHPHPFIGTVTDNLPGETFDAGT